MSLPLVPFFWLWTILPINHPGLTYANYFSHDSPAFYLNLLLKVPLFIADVGAGVLIMKLVRMITSSEAKSRSAVLLWFANPFNIFWTNAYGGVDVIPAEIVLLATYFGARKRNFLSGFSLSVGGLLRIFPFLTFPFMVSSLRHRSLRSIVYMLTGFSIPVILALVGLYVSNGGSLEVVSLVPTWQTWLLDFLGISLTDQNVKSAFVLIALQLLVCTRFWKYLTHLHLVTVSILALFISSLAYAGSDRHFMWVSPMLTISVAINAREVWVFIFTFVSAFAVSLASPDRLLIGPFLVGIFYGAKTLYLLMINQTNINPKPTALLANRP
jgi:Gpi18-like mannosyltransferase